MIRWSPLNSFHNFEALKLSFRWPAACPVVRHLDRSLALHCNRYAAKLLQCGMSAPTYLWQSASTVCTGSASGMAGLQSLSDLHVCCMMPWLLLKPHTVMCVPCQSSGSVLAREPFALVPLLPEAQAVRRK